MILIFSQFFHSQSPSLGGERRNDKPGGMNRKLIPFYPPSLYATSADGQSGGMRSIFLVPSNWVLTLEASVTKAKTPITEHLKFSQQTFKQNHWGILSNTRRALLHMNKWEESAGKANPSIPDFEEEIHQRNTLGNSARSRSHVRTEPCFGRSLHTTAQSLLQIGNCHWLSNPRTAELKRCVLVFGETSWEPRSKILNWTTPFQHFSNLILFTMPTRYIQFHSLR